MIETVSKQEVQYRKKGKYYTVFRIKDNLLICYNKTVFYVHFSTPL